MVEGDAARLEQVISNLLHNAAKYTEPGGRIAVTLERQEPDAVLTIADNGIGIAPELLPVVFDLFTQAQRSLDRTQGGLGIGLALVQRLTQMHGGTVTAANSGLGHGSTFTLRFPLLARAGAEVAAASAPRQAVPHVARRVLVVDDNADSVDRLSALLTLNGHDVRAAAEGVSAIVLAQTLRPQVVLLDIGLPGIDGLEVARRLRAIPETQTTTDRAHRLW